MWSAFVSPESGRTRQRDPLGGFMAGHRLAVPMRPAGVGRTVKPCSTRLLSAFAPGRLLLGPVAAAAATALATAATASAGALSALLGSVRGVGDRGGPGLAHALLAQTFVLLI